MKKNYNIDIIMPNFNKSLFIKDSISSVINQTYQNWRLIVIDNCSTDNSNQVLSEFNNEEKINLVFLHKNMGAAFSRNLGLRISNSNYISFLDSDDYWSKDKLSDQINQMEENNLDFTYTDYTPFKLKNNIKIFSKCVVPKDSYNFMLYINDTSIATSTMILKRSIISTIKFPKIKSFEDYPFKCKVLKLGHKAFRINKNSMYYRITKNTLSSNKIKNLYWILLVNKKYNKLNFFQNIKSLLLISYNSIKKYGFK